MKIQDVPEGCQEIPGFILPISNLEKPAWLTQDGKVTYVWNERGVWHTEKEAKEAINDFCI